MKPGRGIFCPFRVNPRIFSGPPTRLTLPPCPSALLPSLFALPPLSSPSTFDPSTYAHLLRCFHLLPSSHTFAVSLSSSTPPSFLVYSFHPFHHFFTRLLFPFPSEIRNFDEYDNSMTMMSLHNSTASRILYLNFISCRYVKLSRVIKCHTLFLRKRKNKVIFF